MKIFLKLHNRLQTVIQIYAVDQNSPGIKIAVHHISHNIQPVPAAHHKPYCRVQFLCKRKNESTIFPVKVPDHLVASACGKIIAVIFVFCFFVCKHKHCNGTVFLMSILRVQIVSGFIGKSPITDLPLTVIPVSVIQNLIIGCLPGICNNPLHPFLTGIQTHFQLIIFLTVCHIDSNDRNENKKRKRPVQKYGPQKLPFQRSTVFLFHKLFFHFFNTHHITVDSGKRSGNPYCAKSFFIHGSRFGICPSYHGISISGFSHGQHALSKKRFSDSLGSFTFFHPQRWKAERKRPPGTRPPNGQKTHFPL